MVEAGFTNYTKGIKDPSVFVIPPECNTAPLLQLVVLPLSLSSLSLSLLIDINDNDLIVKLLHLSIATVDLPSLYMGAGRMISKWLYS